MIKLGNTSIIKVYKGDTEVIAAYKGVNLVYTKGQEEDYVDLGLPSGLLWAKGNIVSDGNGGYMVGEETDYGAYFSWGNIVPHFSTNGSTFDDSYDFGTSNSGPYASTPGASLGANIPTNDAQHDAALALLGSPWHLPTKDDFQELYDNTDNEWTTINGVVGRKFMKKTDHSVYVFFPAAGRGGGTSLSVRGSYGDYWSGSCRLADRAYYSYFGSSSMNPQSYNYRYVGYSVRAVSSPHYDITITLNPTDQSSVSGVTVTVVDSEGYTHTGTTSALGVVTLTGVVAGSATVSVNDLDLTPSTITVSSSSTTFTIDCNKEPDYVDLGLPSGILWAKGNLVKDSQGNYSIGSETDWGTYVSWGNIDGHNEGEGYNFNQTTYNSTPGKQVAADIPSNDAAHDIALATLGTPWHLPTKADFQELCNNTDSEWVADYNGTGVAGRKFMKKSDHSVYVFFPASGTYSGTSLNTRGTQGYYWSTSFFSSTKAYYLYFANSGAYPLEGHSCYRGFTVRPVTLPFARFSLHFQDGSGVALAGISVFVTDGNGAHSMTTDASGNIVMNVVKGNVTLSSNEYSLDITTINVSGDISTVITGTEIDFSTRYLTFEAIESGTFAFTNSLSYSINNGSTWVSLAANTNTPTISAGNKIMFKATLTPTSDSGIGTFSSTGRFDAIGNPMSLLYGDNFVGQTSLLEKSHAFTQLFSSCTKLVNAGNLALPATKFGKYCYRLMFYSCTSLITAPELPATTLGPYCYQYMFMSCTSLTIAPELPATTLEIGCYQGMFYSCTNITAASDLPATTLVTNCYYNMFYNCRSLNSIKCLVTNTPTTDCLYNWVYGVASSGTFIKADSMTGWTTGVHGIPTGWTVQNASS